jgi:hypothetical protein
LVRGPHPGIVLNEHFDDDGEIVFREARKLGCEGIVSKRLALSPRAFATLGEGQNPKAPAVKREAEGDWRR